MLVSAALLAAFTGVLAALAGATAWFARGAYNAQKDQVEILGRQEREQRALNRQQVEVLQLQAAELIAAHERRSVDTAQQRRAQAVRVFTRQELLPRDPRVSQAQAVGWAAVRAPSSDRKDTNVLAVYVQNTSDQPVRDVDVLWHRGTAAAGDPEHLDQLMPGPERPFYWEFPAGTKADNLSATVKFSDANGVRWLRLPDGELVEQPVDQSG